MCALCARQLALVLPVLGDPDARAYAESAQEGDTAKQKDVGAALQAMAGPDTRIGFACTGFAVPAAQARLGRHLHARNLDADLYNWNTAPVLSLVDETAGHADRHKYVACFGAGKRSHFDLARWLERLDRVETEGGAAVALPDPIFTSAE